MKTSKIYMCKDANLCFNILSITDNFVNEQIKYSLKSCYRIIITTGNVLTILLKTIYFWCHSKALY